MCRLAGYVGPPISLERFLLHPPHSLVVQAWRPKELRYAALNADGFGIGWYAPDEAPAVYISPMPIWSDVNLPSLARTLSCDLWIAAVRSATAGQPTGYINTPPFHDGELLFTHNGLIRDFAATVRGTVREFLEPEIEAGVSGNTDSEYVFAVLRQLLAGDEDLSVEDAIGETMALLAEWLGEDQPALLNLLVSDGERLYATRHAISGECPSLYYTTDDECFPGGQAVASERLTESEFWLPVPEHHILILDPQEPPDLLAL
jgi:gamma-glutamyl hercynylcysteine S-oxide hydrolase